MVAKQAREVSPQIHTKTLLLMTTSQQAGSLVDALLVFKKHGINMTKLESRPIYGKPWEEMFYLEIEGNIHHPEYPNCPEELKQFSNYLKVLGCYPSEIVNLRRYNENKKSGRFKTTLKSTALYWQFLGFFKNSDFSMILPQSTL